VLRSPLPSPGDILAYLSYISTVLANLSDQEYYGTPRDNKKTLLEVKRVKYTVKDTFSIYLSKHE
jgi:hypothetical protein